LPIICDDLLITADEGRAAALLRLLGAAAAHSEVIVFSHKPHLIDFARKAVVSDNFRPHTIDALGVIAAQRLRKIVESTILGELRLPLTSSLLAGSVTSINDRIVAGGS
jgi:hypothetical protein